MLVTCSFTGKSSIICAICVGLAGSLKVLGRSDHADKFIKDQEPEGSIDIYLAGHPRQDLEGSEPHPISVRCVLRRKQRPQFYLDGSPATKDEVSGL